MTEYGRGHGSEPWHPEDPLFGDQGWGGQQAASGQSPYGGQPQYYPQQPQQPHPQQSYGGQQQGGYPQHDGQQGGYPQHGGQQQGGYPQHDYNGGWDTGQQPAYGAGPDPYGGQPAAYDAERPDPYNTPDAYPPPQPPGRRREAPRENPDWDPGPDQGEHAFFASGRDDEDDDYDDEPPRGGRGRGRGRSERRGRGGKKRRSGCACLVVTLVFAGGLGGVGYFGYQFYQDRFGSAADYEGNGNADKQVSVEIPKGAGGSQIGSLLEEKGVVKSADAFVNAQAKDPKGLSIQAGVYLLNTEMSGEAAVTMMLDPKSRNNLMVNPGWRNNQVYEQIDKRLEQPKGSTRKYVKEHWKELGLPEWAKNPHKDVKDPLEGFLYPGSYPVAKGMKTEDILKKMVDDAKQAYSGYNLEGKAKELKVKDPLQLLTVASLVQSEGNNKSDYEKIARVVYNRMVPGNAETAGLLDFDSTVNYLKGESKLATGSVDELRKIKDPYNTYKIYGLPPGPISNPGKEAFEAALSPAKGKWYYFVSINANETLFAETNAQHERNRQKYLDEQKKNQ